MAEASVEHKLNVCFGQEYRVKLGKSFTFPKENAFHAIKYDFKPLSIDPNRPGRLKVSEDEVNVSLPVGQGELAEDFAQFRGGKKPCTKECVLIIDTNTGEAILEKIGNTVNLKAIRDGRKSVLARDRSISPSPYPSHMNQTKTQPPAKSQLATSSAVANSTPTSYSSTVATTAGKTTSGRTKGAKRHNKKAPKNVALSSSSLKQDGVTKSAGSVGKSKRNTHKVKTETHNSTASSSAVSNSIVNSSNSLNLPTHMVTAAAPSMPSFSELAPPPREISPIHSNNPTPEPIVAPPPNKKSKVDLPSSSSSSSDSSDDGVELPLKAPPTHLLQQYQQPVATSNVHHHNMQMSHMPQIAHKSGHYQGHMTQMPHLIGQQQQQQQQQQSHHHHHQQQQQQSVIDVQSSSSSDSDSGSSSGSSSSDSSSDSSDQENDREVASYNSQPPLRQMSMSLLRTDLHLSDTGSDSD